MEVFFPKNVFVLGGGARFLKEQDVLKYLLAALLMEVCMYASKMDTYKGDLRRSPERSRKQSAPYPFVAGV